MRRKVCKPMLMTIMCPVVLAGCAGDYLTPENEWASYYYDAVPGAKSASGVNSDQATAAAALGM